MAGVQAQKHLLFRMQKAAIEQINRQETRVLTPLDFPEYGFCNDKIIIYRLRECHNKIT